MYLLYVTSFVLLAPAILSSILGHQDITIAILACLVTSIANHGIRGRYTLIRMLDILTLHTIGAYYIIHAVQNIVQHHEVMYIIPIAFSVIIGTMFWLCTRYINNTASDLYKHAFIHVLGAVGVCMYSIVRYTYHTQKNDIALLSSSTDKRNEVLRSYHTAQ